MPRKTKVSVLYLKSLTAYKKDVSNEYLQEKAAKEVSEKLKNAAETNEIIDAAVLMAKEFIDTIKKK